MTHTRYWAMSLATAVAGAFIAVERFAFSASASIWITFGVAIAATVLSLVAFGVALLRENRSFSGLSALSALVGGFTIVAMRSFNAPTSLWLALASGVALLVISLRALALHETTVERVTYALEHRIPLASVEDELLALSEPHARASSGSGAGSLARRLEVSAPMRSWTYWLALTGIAVAGVFVTLMTFALHVPGTSYDTLRWLSFGVGGVGAGVIALGALMQRLLVAEPSRARSRKDAGRASAILAMSASFAVAVAMIVTMAVYSTATLRWIAFGLALGLAAISLLAQIAHELTSERVRHELEVAAPARALQASGQPAQPGTPAA